MREGGVCVRVTIFGTAFLALLFVFRFSSLGVGVLLYFLICTNLSGGWFI